MNEHEARSNSEQRRISTTFSDDELLQIDTWGFSKHIRNRAEVIRQLVKKALEAKEMPAPAGE